jgi:Ran-binding protein 1
MSEPEAKVNNSLEVVEEKVAETGRKRTESEESPTSPDIEFKPIIELPLVETKTLEEEEEALISLRSRLYRFETAEDPPEWKERGTGEVKILKHKTTGIVRLLMRRDKTLKICANHYIKSNMELKKHANNSDKAWVYSTLADFADEKPRAETLCIKFGNAESATKFKAAFDEAKKLAESLEEAGDLSLKMEKVKLESKESQESSDSGEGSNCSQDGAEAEEGQSPEDENPEADQHLKAQNGAGTKVGPEKAEAEAKN